MNDQKATLREKRQYQDNNLYRVSEMATNYYHDTDIPTEIDFSEGIRGKFYHKDAQLRLPIQLEAEVQTGLAAVAVAKGMDFSALINSLLKQDLARLQIDQ